MRLVFFVLLLLVNTPVFALELTESLQLKVADTFFEEGEFYRAVTEYKRFSILFPDSAKNDYAEFQEGMAYYSGGKYKRAISVWQRFREGRSERPYNLHSHFYEGLALWKTKKYKGAGINFDILVDFYSDTDLAPRALGAKVLMAVDEKRIEQAQMQINLFGGKFPAFEEKKIEKSKRLLVKYAAAPRKSKVTAGIMSSTIPGAGYFYADRYGDGFSALIVNGLFIGGAIESFSKGNNTAGYILASFGLPFYLGNIYGSANAAQKWNISIRKPIKDEIFATLNFVF